ncbi:hypothetical protein MHU86_12124 [Fragilaria crotonensis]|nr:hypothetical protein MHU86_12124 [Fragilaria crotonensis]
MRISARRSVMLFAFLLMTIVYHVAFIRSESLMISSFDDKAKQNDAATAKVSQPFSDLVNMKFEKKHNDTVGVCVAVRTYFEHSTALTTLLLSLREAASKVPPGRMSLFVFIVDTEGQKQKQHANFVSDSIYVARMVHAREQQTRGEQASHDVFFEQTLKEFNHTCMTDYGYQATQEIIDVLVDNDNCDWIVTTNGDNLFGPRFFERTGVFDEESVSIVGVDFATHHLREARDGQMRMYQHIPVAMSLGNVDLSSVLVRRKALAECPNAKFFPSCEEVKFYQDWVVLEMLLEDCNATYRLVPEILLLHN